MKMPGGHTWSEYGRGRAGGAGDKCTAYTSGVCIHFTALVRSSRPGRVVLLFTLEGKGMSEKIIRRQISISETEYAALRRLSGNRRGSFGWFVWSAIREKIARDTGQDPITILTSSRGTKKP